MDYKRGILKLSARDLDKKEFSGSDPVCFVETGYSASGPFENAGQTEQVTNNHFPNFNQTIQLNYASDSLFLKVELFHTSKKTSKNSLGQTIFPVRELLEKRELCKKLEGVKKGSVFIYLCHPSEIQDEILLKIMLPKGQEVKLYRKEVDASFVKIALGNLSKCENVNGKSEQRVKLSLIELCAGNLQRLVQLKVQGEDVRHTVSLIDLLSQKAGKHLVLKGARGDISLCAQCIPKKLQCTVAIDFTKSNLATDKAESLHWLGGGSPNDYEKTLDILLQELQQSDNRDPLSMYAFGANVDGKMQQCFPLSDYSVPQSEVRQVYKRSVQRVALGQPTLLAPVICHVMQEAERTQIYQLLVIITDGVAADMRDTKSAIIEASSRPVSIVIVGVGQQEFDPLLELSSDEDMITVDGKSAERDIVHFLPFCDLEEREPSCSMLLSGARKHMNEHLVMCASRRATL